MPIDWQRVAIHFQSKVSHPNPNRGCQNNSRNSQSQSQRMLTLPNNANYANNLHNELLIDLWTLPTLTTIWFRLTVKSFGTAWLENHNGKSYLENEWQTLLWCRHTSNRQWLKADWWKKSLTGKIRTDERLWQHSTYTWIKAFS